MQTSKQPSQQPLPPDFVYLLHAAVPTPNHLASDDEEEDGDEVNDFADDENDELNDPDDHD